MLRLPRNLHFEVHQVLYLPRNLLRAQSAVACHETCTSRSTKCCTCHEICTSRSQSAVPATKSANEPHVQKSRFTAPVTKSELPDDHHHVQSAAPATKTALRSKTAPIPCTCHEKSTLEHQNTRFPLRLPRKVTTMYRKCARHHNESAVARSTRPAGRFCEPAQSKCTWTMSSSHPRGTAI